MKRLSQLLPLLFHYETKHFKDVEISNIEMDSRYVTEGTLFFCVKGYTVDGHDFATNAIKKGAVALIVERELALNVPQIIVSDVRKAMARLSNGFYDAPTGKLQLIGVTGTNGKTSITHMISEVYREAAKRTGVIGTVHIKINDEIRDVKNTTPESITLQKTFYDMVDAGVEMAAMEVSSHALHLGRVHGCQFDIAVFTNLTQDHLDYHGTMEAYRHAKSLLFAQLGNTINVAHPKYAILNNDDEASEEYKFVTQAQIITYGIEKQSDVQAYNIKVDGRGTTFTLRLFENTYEVRTKLVGKFNVYNLLSAIAASYVGGIEIEAILKAVEKMVGVAGRFQVVESDKPYTAIVDYAHTPDSLENVLHTIREFAKGKVYCIIGCGGDRDKTKRPLMAQAAVSLSDVAILTSDNPRSENPETILDDMTANLQPNEYIRIIDRKAAIDYAVSHAKAGDIILVAGKGHETYQIIGSEVHDFDDYAITQQLMNEK